MPLNIKVHKLSLQDYFGLSKEVLEQNYRDENINIITTTIDDISWLLALTVSPKNYCWGGRFNCPEELKNWQELSFTEESTVSGLRNIFDLYKINSKFVMAGMTKYHEIGGENTLMMGEEVGELPSEWFRVEVLPISKGILDKYLVLIEEHISQLEDFFLLPFSDSFLKYGKIEVIQMENNMKNIFYDKPGENISNAEIYERSIRDLKYVTANLKPDTVKQWITPFFLEGETVILNYPIPTSINKTDLLFGLIFQSKNNLKARHEKKKKIALLRIKLLRKYRWPLGLRKLITYKKDQIYRNFILENSSSWRELEDEVEAYINESKTLYPVLFKKLF